MSFLKKQYNESINSLLMKEFNIKNSFAVPRIIKVVVNVGVGEALTNKKAIATVQEQIERITGQKSVVMNARKSIAAFKIRKGLAIGVKVTLRGEKMYSFVEKFVSVVLPRIRDFRGIADNTLDGHGNLNVGLNEQTLFPEIEYDKIDKIRGLEVTIVTTTKNRDQSKRLFELIGIPFQK